MVECSIVGVDAVAGKRECCAKKTEIFCIPFTLFDSFAKTDKSNLGRPSVYRIFAGNKEVLNTKITQAIRRSFLRIPNPAER